MISSPCCAVSEPNVYKHYKRLTRWNANRCCSLRMAVFTLEDEQIVWSDKSSQTNKSSDVKTGRTNFSTNKSSDIWPSGKTIFPGRFVRTNKSTTLRHRFTSDGQMPDDLSVQTICSSSGVKTANHIPYLKDLSNSFSNSFIAFYSCKGFH